MIDEDQILRKALRHYGMVAQKRKFTEEAAEAIKEMAKCQSNDRIVEELADLQVMLRQMKLAYPRVQEKYVDKLKKLDEQVDAEKNVI